METIALIAGLVLALLDGGGKWYTTVDLGRRRMRLSEAEADWDRLRRERQELEARREKASLKQREFQNDCRSMVEDLSRVRAEIESLQKEEEGIRGPTEGDGGA